MKSSNKLVMVIFLTTLILGGCTTAQTTSTNLKANSVEQNQSNLENTKASEIEGAVVSEETIESDESGMTETEDKVLVIDESENIESTVNEVDYQIVKPDESKEIMVIMYHNLSEKNTDYGRTVESFEQDLERLYDMGFRTISMQDYIQNNITTEAGYTPVVLTFDDGHVTNFKYIENEGKLIIDPDCVVGILDAFSKTHLGFGRNAIFYLNYGNAFGQAEYLDQKITYLLENGYEIGSHTFSHEDLSTLDANGIQTALGKNATLYHEINPMITMNSLALPYGKRPKDETLKTYVEHGAYEGNTYENKAILLVGWKPYYPTYHVKYDFSSINRVQSGDGEMQLTWWLDNYEKSPSKRFISDGNPDRISVPTECGDQIDVNKVEGKELYLYELESK